MAEFKQALGLNTIADYIRQYEIERHEVRWIQAEARGDDSEAQKERQIIDAFKTADSLRGLISGDKDALDVEIENYHVGETRKGKPMVRFNNGSILYYPEAKYGRFIKMNTTTTDDKKGDGEMTTKTLEDAQYLIRYFNMIHKTSFKMVQKNIDAINKCFEAGYSVPDLQKAVKEFNAGDDGEGWLLECFNVHRLALRGSKQDAPKEDKPAGQAVVNPNIQMTVNPTFELKAEGIFERALAKAFLETHGAELSAALTAEAKAHIEQYIRDTYGDLPRRTPIEVNGEVRKVNGITHEKFETVLAFVANNEPVFLSGPAGSGKNHLCKQVAEALGLDFYFSNAVTQEYKLTGFTDAMGVFQESQFYKAFKNGGLFMLDEIDASIPEVLVILNAAIANRYFDFPAPIGYVEAYKDFRVVAAGNTFGLGATYQYVGRNQLDAASLDRFAIVEIDYSPAIEEAVGQGNTELVMFCRDFRKAAEKAGQQVIVSYRAISRMAKMEKSLDLRTMLRTCLLKNLERDDIRMILIGMKTDTKYRKELERMVA